MFTYVLCLAFVASFVSSTPINQCESEIALPVNVDIINCDKQPCELPKGTDVNMNVTVAAPFYIEGMKVKVVANAFGIQTTYPLPNSNVCEQLIEGECPLEEDEEFTYQLKMPILSIYPKISLGLTFTIYNDDGDITCFQVNCKVV